MQFRVIIREGRKAYGYFVDVKRKADAVLAAAEEHVLVKGHGQTDPDVVSCVAVGRKEAGTAVLTCRNHPTYRWTQTKFEQPWSTRHFLGRGVLMFEGEDGGKPACCFNVSVGTLRGWPAEARRQFLSEYTPECSCPESALLFVRWADERVPSAKEAAAFIDGLAERVRHDAEVLDAALVAREFVEGR